MPTSQTAIRMVSRQTSGQPYNTAPKKHQTSQNDHPKCPHADLKAQQVDQKSTELDGDRKKRSISEKADQSV